MADQTQAGLAAEEIDSRLHDSAAPARTAIIAAIIAKHFPAPAAVGDAREAITEQDIEVAVGGAYEMPDGRKFWNDAPVAREIARRVWERMHRK